MLDKSQSMNLLYKTASFENCDHDTILVKTLKWEGIRLCHDKNSDFGVTLRKHKAKLVRFNFPQLSSN